jgi:drug/metabolite transporter (DMT)-like permease
MGMRAVIRPANDAESATPPSRRDTSESAGRPFAGLRAGIAGRRRASAPTAKRRGADRGRRPRTVTVPVLSTPGFHYDGRRARSRVSRRRSEERRVLWFGLSVGSALFQVLRNMVMKRLGHALDETINVWGRFTFILPFAAAPLLVQGVPARQPGVYWYCFLFAVTQITGTQCLALALKVAEISLVTALWKLSVVLLVVWGYLALGEEPSFLGVVGVLVCVAGVYLINVSRARVSLWAPLVSLVRDPGQRYTLGAALFYAPSVVLIKKIALLSSPTYAVFMGYLFCSVLITPWVLYRSARHFRQLGRHWLGFVGLGAFAALSTQLGTTAYTLTVSSYVEAVKQIEILLALLIGWLMFGEGARVRQIWLGCAVMLVGIVILILGKA